MAYKFQLGSAVLSGSATYKGDIEAGDELKALGGSISGSGDITVTGEGAEITVADTVEFKSANKIEFRDGVLNHEKLKVQPANAIPVFSIKRSGSNTQNIVELNRSNVSSDDYYLQIRNQSNVVGWELNKSGSMLGLGAISGSGNLQCNGTVSANGDVEVGGGLTVGGNLVALSGNLEIDSTIILQVSGGAATDAASRDTGYHFGHLTNGGFITYTSGAVEGVHIALQKGSGAGIPLKATTLLGDGSNLSGISSTSRYPLKDLNFTISGKVCDKNSTNVIKTAPSNQQEIQLPATSSLLAGDIVRIKLEATADETNRVKITKNGATEKVAIDDEPELLLMSPSASVDLIYLGLVNGSGSFAIF